MYRQSTLSPAHSWPKPRRQVFTQECRSKSPIHAHTVDIHMHSLCSVVSLFCMLKKKKTQSSPQSTGCNIPVSHPGPLDDDITVPRKRQAFEVRGGLVGLTEKARSQSWVHGRIAGYPSEMCYIKWKTNRTDQVAEGL